MFSVHIPVFHHLTKLADAAVNKILLHTVRVANNAPEKVSDFYLELIISGIFA